MFSEKSNRISSTKVLVTLLKAHHIKRIVISPGTTNIPFVSLIQKDTYFELYSSADERSAAYIACGIASESGEPVVITCTGATASRNYVPGLTEAFYRKLPILAVTGSQPLGRIGHGSPQMIDRTDKMNDIAKMSISISPISTAEDKWTVETSINDALLELRHRGGGPVHINLITEFEAIEDTNSELSDVRVINRYSLQEIFPKLPKVKKIAVFVGSHRPFSDELTEAIDSFCLQNGAVVLCDQSSNYRGRYRILANILADQDMFRSDLLDIDLLIHIGDISGAYMNIRPKECWRVSEDGLVMDTFGVLTKVFEANEIAFFRSYCNADTVSLQENMYYRDLTNSINSLRNSIPDLPFSNIWCAQHLSKKLPENSILHLGILNSLRAWNFFETDSSITCWANTGGFGIDGGTSTLLGLSLASPNKLCFGVTGDLAFFYDLNVLGNRHVNRNIRILLINNGCGTEFKHYSHPASKLGDDADGFIAAAGHYGCKSHDLINHFAEDLGFYYLSADNKDAFIANIDIFTNPHEMDKPIIFEVFTDPEEESEALRLISNLYISPEAALKKVVKDIVGDRGIAAAKKILGR